MKQLLVLLLRGSLSNWYVAFANLYMSSSLPGHGLVDSTKFNNLV